MNPEPSKTFELDFRDVVDRLRTEVEGIIAHLEDVRGDLEALGEVTSRLPTQSAVPRRLLTVAEAADALAVCQTTVKRLVASGQIESRKIGAARRIPVEALDAFVGNADGST